jgi:hypothetical protein
MIRLEDNDFDEIKNVARLALIGNMSTEEFIDKFKYLINDPPVKEPKIKEVPKQKAEKKS